jgi:hypothetical protein
MLFTARSVHGDSIVPLLDPPIMAILGALSMLAGVGLVIWGARHLGSDSDPRADSLLAPTLAADTLDPDLRVLYARTLVLDAQCQRHYGDDDRAQWSVMGRELRRALVATQSRRIRGVDAPSADTLERLLDRAIERVRNGEPLDDEWRGILETVREHTAV